MQSFKKVLDAAQAEQKKLDNHSSSTKKPELIKSVEGKPFWIWSQEVHRAEYIKTKGRCCWNHIIGLPVKDKRKHPMYPYEQELFEALEQKTKRLWVKKATGLGITEFILRYMAYLCTRDDKLMGSQMVILTAPRIDLAINEIERIKALLRGGPAGNRLTFDTKETVLQLNGVKIEAFPSHHLDSVRGLAKVSFVFLDESDFWLPSDQQSARAIAERYIAKSNPYIVMVSTPNAPGGLFEQIEKEKDSIYHKIKLPYTVGEGLIYSKEELHAAMSSPSFEREYNLAYIGQTGNLFSIEEIQRAVALGEKTYDPTEIATDTHKVLALDPSWSSSKFGYCVMELGHSTDGSGTGQINVLMADELEDKPLFQDAIDFVVELIHNIQINRVYVDGANVSYIASLKAALGENSRYQDELKYFKDNGLDPEKYGTMKVLPVNFSTEHKKILEHCKHLMDGGYIAIHPSLTRLITALRTATATEFALDKNLSAHNDIFDAFRMCCKYFNLEEEARGFHTFG
jgi:hypothetical protein